MIKYFPIIMIPLIIIIMITIVIARMHAHSKISVISLNVEINKRKSIHICGYKLPINVQVSGRRYYVPVIGWLLF